MASRNSSRLKTFWTSSACWSAKTRASQSAWKGSASSLVSMAPNPVVPPTSFILAMRPAYECRSEISALLLLPLDRLEEGLEVALAEAHGAVPLDHLEEDGRLVLDRLGEDLEQVAVLVAVDEDLQLAQRLDGH